MRSHPAWLLGLAMVHHPLLAAVGAAVRDRGGCAPMRAAQHLPLRDTADALAAPLALALAFEQFGALLAGSGYGTETTVRWAVIYTHPLAARWSGTPLGVPLHPVQAYAALAFLTLAVFCLSGLPHRRQPGDWPARLMAIGVAIYFTEFWRDPEGRGSMLRRRARWPAVAAIVLVLAGALRSARPKRGVRSATEIAAWPACRGRA